METKKREFKKNVNDKNTCINNELKIFISLSKLKIFYEHFKSVLKEKKVKADISTLSKIEINLNKFNYNNNNVKSELEILGIV